MPLSTTHLPAQERTPHKPYGIFSYRYYTESFSITIAIERSSRYIAMQQQVFYFISRKYVHDVQQK
ncbi:hypothetical protein NQ318_009211 [Aromia moschata]|uniref:Uncharacterized protein n=1 Tax=Aromia moschata TaxID=1265417 RepID=A0AAV8WZ66_9CUCU|nr:hypothetical protein NQ318_009211 [Aromia moschata]